MQNNHQNSWYLNRPLQQCINLFQKEDNDYQAHFYACVCGMQEVIVSVEGHTPSYVCKACDNNYFIHSYHAMQGINIYLHYVGVTYTYKCEHTNNGFKATAYLDVPIDTNFMQKCIYFKQEEIESFEIILEYGKAIEVSNPRATERSVVLKKHLYAYILSTYNDDRRILSYFKHEKNTTKQVELILYCLGLPKYLDYIFYIWKVDFNLFDVAIKNTPITIDMMMNYLLNSRTDKSLTQALIERYRATFWDSVGKYSFYNPASIYMFDPLVPFVVSRCFDDPSIASHLLRQDWFLFEHNHIEQDNKRDYADNVIWLIEFLKKHYTETELADLLLSIPTDIKQWLDIISLASHNKRAIHRYFKVIELNLHTLYKEIQQILHRSEHRQNYFVKFSYEKYYIEACVVFGDMDFRLPSTGTVLDEWARKLEIDYDVYPEGIHHGFVTIFGVFVDNILVYTVEFYQKEIRAMSAKNDLPLAKKEAKQIKKWHKQYFNPTGEDKDAYTM